MEGDGPWTAPVESGTDPARVHIEQGSGWDHPEKERGMSMREVQPILYASSIEQSVAFYQEHLGFELRFAMTGDGGRMVHASLVKDAVTIMLGYKEAEHPDQRLGGGAVLYTYVDDVDGYFEQVVAAGTALTEALTDQYWGDRTFTVTDPDGYVLTFAQTVRAFDPSNAPVPAGAVV